MVYIAPDGSVHNSQPWGVQRAKDTFWAFVLAVWLFFQTIMEPLTSLTDGANGGGGGSGSSGFRNSRGGGGGFFGGGGGGGGRGPPRPPSNRRIGRIDTTPSCSVPGGCCGGQ